MRPDTTTIDPNALRRGAHAPTARRLPIALVCLLSVMLVPASPARAAVRHVLDPKLSLQGNCIASTGDPIVDPGCPYPEGPGADAPAPFKKICGVATDRLGYVYVSGGPQGSTEWFIQVFNPKGLFVTKFPVPPAGSCRLAVDSQGRIHLARSFPSGFRYTPSSYPPTKATTYAAAGIAQAEGVAVDPTNDNYYVASGSVTEYKPNGEPDGVSEVQKVAVDATGGGFNLNYASSAVAATGNLTAGSPTVTALVTATGTGNLTAGSTALTSLATTAGAFEVGQPVEGAGIPAGTTITEVTRSATSGFIRLSQAATASGAAVALTSQGPGQFSTAIVNKPIVGPGIPPGTTIAAASAGTLTLSKNATASGSGVTLNAGDERELPTSRGRAAPPPGPFPPARPP